MKHLLLITALVLGLCGAVRAQIGPPGSSLAESIRQKRAAKAAAATVPADSSTVVSATDEAAVKASAKQAALTVTGPYAFARTFNLPLSFTGNRVLAIEDGSVKVGMALRNEQGGFRKFVNEAAALNYLAQLGWEVSPQGTEGTPDNIVRVYFLHRSQPAASTR